MIVTTGAPVERVAYAKIPQAAAIAASGSMLMNTMVWLVGTLASRMTIGLLEVLLFSVLGVLGGTGLYAVLGRWARRPIRLFRRISIAVLVLYALGPIAAAQAPYMDGAEAFNTATIIATELMHVISGAWIIGALTLRARGELPR